jgi:hypothetical protein
MCNDLADAIGTNGVSFLSGKENVLEVEAPSSLKQPGQSEAPSAPKYVALVTSLILSYTDCTPEKSGPRCERLTRHPHTIVLSYIAS